MAVESQVTKTNGGQWQVSLRNLEKGIGWMVFRRYHTKKAAYSVAETMEEKT